MTTLPPGYVRMTCDDPPLDVVALLGPDAVRIAGGVGGWEVTARPRQVGMTTWAGVEPLSVELSLMFDGWAAGVSQETPLGKLLTVARGDDQSPPGVVALDGVTLPVDEWVIEDMAFGDVIIDPASRERVRQVVSLTLREHVEPTYLQQRKRALQGSKGKTRVVTVKRGDTPARIARRQHCKWTDLRTLNAGVVTKANQNLKDGSQLRVPVQTTKQRRAKGSLKGKGKSRSNR